MTTLHPHTLKDAARSRLANASCDPQKLIFSHTGIILLASLVLTVVDYLLEKGIGTTGGLSGMGLRSMLETVQTVLRYGQTIALPFWQIGYIYAILRVSRGEHASFGSLSEGFRRFRPVLRLKLCVGCLYFAIGMATSYISSTIFMLTPYSTPMMEKLMPLLEDESLLQDAAALEAAMLEVMDSVLVPLLVIFLLVFLVLALPVSYRLRMADRCLLDAPEEGALHAMRQSTRLTKGNCLKLVKLDLSFWWFYGLDALVTAVAYGDLILGAVTEKSSDVTYFGFFGLYLLCQLGLYCWRRNQVETTYALAYEALRAPREPAPAPQPGTQPWNYE